MSIPTRPTVVPPPVPLDWQPRSTWCSSCEVHQATNFKPICPVCLDEAKREKDGAA